MSKLKKFKNKLFMRKKFKNKLLMRKKFKNKLKKFKNKLLMRKKLFSTSVKNVENYMNLMTHVSAEENYVKL